MRTSRSVMQQVSRLIKAQQFLVKPVKQEAYEEHFAILSESFAKREPISMGIGLQSNEIEHLMHWLLRTSIESDSSYCIVNSETQEIVAGMYTAIHTRGEDSNLTDSFEIQSDRMETFLKLLKILKESVDLFADSQVQKYVEILGATVKPEYMGHKYIYQLTKECEDRAQDLGCQLITTQASNSRIQHIRRKTGYTPCLEINYEDLEIDGKRVLDVSKMGDSTKAVIYKKYLA